MVRVVSLGNMSVVRVLRQARRGYRAGQIAGQTFSAQRKIISNPSVPRIPQLSCVHVSHPTRAWRSLGRADAPARLEGEAGIR